MIKIEDIKDGAVFMTKKGHKIEIVKVHEDYLNGSAEIRRYVHRDSENCKNYGWGHNTFYFNDVTRILEGKKNGLVNELNNEGYKLK